MKNLQQPFMLIIYGPTGVGKTDLALEIAKQIPTEIINMDVGQFYTPLSIGTAKPDWKNSPIPHHLFDIIDTPRNYTVNEYRTAAYKKVEEVIARSALPILVGGSGFYLYSLLFQQGITVEDTNISHVYSKNANWWQELYGIDPVRASQIDPSDTYRLKRALGIWHATGKLPSSLAPIYRPQADYVIIFVERDRQELKKRIDDRVIHMLNSGWIDEAEKLVNTPWQEFLRKKNLIGYGEIFDYLVGKKDNAALRQTAEAISIQTRQYAKRQFTFWRKLEREIKKEKLYTGTYVGCLETVNLTHMNSDAYVNKLSFIWSCQRRVE